MGDVESRKTSKMTKTHCKSAHICPKPRFQAIWDLQSERGLPDACVPTVKTLRLPRGAAHSQHCHLREDMPKAAASAARRSVRCAIITSALPRSPHATTATCTMSASNSATNSCRARCSIRASGRHTPRRSQHTCGRCTKQPRTKGQLHCANHINFPTNTFSTTTTTTTTATVKRQDGCPTGNR